MVSRGFVLFVLIGGALAAGAVQGDVRFLGPDGRPLPLQTDGEIENFLLSAQPLMMQELADGVTHAHKLRLASAEMQAHAVFREVSAVRRSRPLPSGEPVVLRDDCIFEEAAYRLDRLLGLRRIPPVVSRTIDGRRGTLQLWVEGSVTEKERRRRKEPIGSTTELDWQQMTLFDNLIFNDDRNRGNVLYDATGRLWMIDHTQAFRHYPELPYPEAIERCERRLWERLRTLTDVQISEALSPLLEAVELDALLERRRLLVEYLTRIIEERGAAAVLYDSP